MSDAIQPDDRKQGSEDFQFFRQLVFEDPVLQAELLAFTDARELFQAVVEAGERRGLHFEPCDVEAVFQTSQMEWNLSRREL